MCKKRESAVVCPVVPPVAGNSCCCNLPTLVVLILIVLQFSKKGSHGSKFDNGILFIIALFYLSCCNPCKDMMY